MRGLGKVQGGSHEERPRVEAGKPRENPEGDWIIVPGTHDALMRPTTFDRVQELTKTLSRYAP